MKFSSTFASQAENDFEISSLNSKEQEKEKLIFVYDLRENGNNKGIQQMK